MASLGKTLDPKGEQRCSHKACTRQTTMFYPAYYRGGHAMEDLVFER